MRPIDETKLIFIVSQPRSGSTLLQSILSNNNEVATVSEPWLLLPFLSIFKPELCRARYDYGLMTKAVNQFVDRHVGRVEFNNELRSFLLAIYSSIKTESEKFVLDKTPRYYEIVNEISAFFPLAKIIVLKRNPFSVLNSIITTWGINSLYKLGNFKRDILSAPVSLHSFAKESKSILNRNVYELRYEDMVLNPKATVSDIYNWLGIEFKEEYLNYQSNNKYKGEFGDQKSIGKYQIPVPDSLDTWKIIMHIPFWNNFFRGYSHHLGVEFLNEYGGYSLGGSSRTGEFDFFLISSQLSDERKYSLKKEIALMFKYLRLYTMFGSPRKKIEIT